MRYGITFSCGATRFETTVDLEARPVPPALRFKFRDGVVDVTAREINGKPVIVIDAGPEIEVKQAGGQCAIVKFK